VSFAGTPVNDPSQCLELEEGEEMEEGEAMEMEMETAVKEIGNEERGGASSSSSSGVSIRDDNTTSNAIAKPDTSAISNSNKNKNDKKNQNKKNDRKDNSKNEKKIGTTSGGLWLPKPLGGDKRGTLMRKLLGSAIDAEENMVLQCFRFFVDSNFFLPVEAETGIAIESGVEVETKGYL
jgi:hypothetical protein